MPHRHANILLVLIVVGVIAGAVSGWMFGPAMQSVAWLGDLFLNALTMMVIPLLVSAVITGVTSIGDVRHLGRAGGFTVAYYLATGAIAVFIGLLMVNWIEPGVGVSTANVSGQAGAAREAIELGKETGFVQILLNMIAPNLIKAAAETQLLPLIIWSIVFGVALTTLGERGKPAVAFFDAFTDAMMRVVIWIMYFTPIGVFGLVAGMLGEAGGGAEFWAKIEAVGWHVFTVLSGLAIHFVVLFLILVFLAGRGPQFLVTMLRALFTALATASSSATLPITMECARENEIDPRAIRFVMPLGSTVNMDGTALYEAAAAVFIAQAYGIDLTFGEQGLIFVTATLAAIGAAGIPQAGLVTMIIVLNAVGLPVEGIGLLLAVDWFLDRFRTSTNVWGDSVGAAVLDRLLRADDRRAAGDGASPPPVDR